MNLRSDTAGGPLFDIPPLVTTPLPKSRKSAKNKYVRAVQCDELAFIFLLGALSKTIIRS